MANETKFLIDNLRVDAELKNLASIRRALTDAASKSDMPKDDIDDFCLAADEACANIIQHGYGDAQGEIRINMLLASSHLILNLEDDAPEFDPLSEAKGADLVAPLELRLPGGLGVLMIRQNTDSAVYEKTKTGGNRLTLVKYF